MKKRAQAAIEYLLVGSLITLIIIPTLYVFYNYSQSSNKEIKQSQLNKVGTDIVDIAEQVYYLGEPSRVTIDATMPEGIKGIEIWRNQELVFFLNDGSEVAFKSKVNITSNIACAERCYYNFTERFYSPGLKSIIIEAKRDRVFIREAGDDQTEQEPIEEDKSYCDEDYDGYYAIESSSSCPSGRSDPNPGDDCNDNDDDMFPGNLEKCDGKDNNCDGSTDEGFDEDDCEEKCSHTWIGNGGSLNCCGDDANEDSPYQENEKTPIDYCSDGNDNDCDGYTDWPDDPDCIECIDSDIDTYYAFSPSCPGSDDCDDDNLSIYPGAPIFCNYDESCNWPVDDSDCGIIDCSGWYNQTGIESAIDTESCYNKQNITSERCESVDDCKDANTSDCNVQDDYLEIYSCGECKYISASDCNEITLGSCSNYDDGTNCGIDMECESGVCVSSCECSSGDNCCSDGCNYDAAGTPCGTKDCDYLDTTCRNYHDKTLYCTGSSTSCPDTTCDSYTDADTSTRCWTGNYGSCGSCSWSSTCDESAPGTRWRDYKTCSAGSCSVSHSEPDSCTCSRDTDGDSCTAASETRCIFHPSCSRYCSTPYQCRVTRRLRCRCLSGSCRASCYSTYYYGSCC